MRTSIKEAFVYGLYRDEDKLPVLQWMTKTEDWTALEAKLKA
jgi:hypothetical protein